MAGLVLGPVLRHVDTESATVWVETDAPCTVEVVTDAVTGSSATFGVAGHHYALVCIDGLRPATSNPYVVRLDGNQVWPDPTSRHPPSRIRTVDPAAPFRLIFGSCRYATPAAVSGDRRFDFDALNAYAIRMASTDPDQWPGALLLLGDQVYADETSDETKRFIAARRDIRQPPYGQVADFEEYTRLYYESWRDPDVRWLMSTVGTMMIFDDHDIRDDWNTSHLWREDMQRTSWWEERITGGLMSYWIYQHIGNLPPAALEHDEMYRRVRTASDAAPELREFAQAADREVDGEKGAQWSYRRDFGRVRLLVIDSRCGRVLAEGRRAMISESEFQWVEAQVKGDYDHLLVGTSLPWLMPRAVHDIESWDEVLAAGERGRLLARGAERLRRGLDLEHWASFRSSFDRLTRLLGAVGSGDYGGSPPATICVLSGDVHHAYVARAHLGREVGSRVSSEVYQLTCSPLHNYVPRVMRWGFRAAWSRAAERTTRWLLDVFSRVPELPLWWDRISGPFFGSEIATLLLDGRAARLILEKGGRTERGDPLLSVVAAIPLAGRVAPTRTPSA